MRLALRLARRGYGATLPNPMVGAALVQGGNIIGRGWHHRAGEPHAEIEALRDAQSRGHSPKGATLYVTLEPCCTQGRTPPCTEAIIGAGISRVVAGATDPNPRHCGRAFTRLRQAGIAVTPGVLAEECERLNEAFNHWIVRRTPFVTVKAAMTLDGKIATAAGESRWITGEPARAYGMKLRQGADAILVGINTILADDPSLTFRSPKSKVASHVLRRIILDSYARTPLEAKVVSDEQPALTTIVVSRLAPQRRVAALSKQVRVLVAPLSSPLLQPLGRFHNLNLNLDHNPNCNLSRNLPREIPEITTEITKVCRGSRHYPSPLVPRPSSLDLRWLLKRLGAEDVTSLLVEGGGEVNASFLLSGLAQRIAFFYAPKILGGRDARRAVAGEGARSLEQMLDLTDLEWRRLGPDWLLSARVMPQSRGAERRIHSA